MNAADLAAKKLLLPFINQLAVVEIALAEVRRLIGSQQRGLSLLRARRFSLQLFWLSWHWTRCSTVSPQRPIYIRL